MLICKNCDTENLDGAAKCCNCKMEDSLVYLRPNEIELELVTVDHHPLSCPNCACESPGEGEKCIECRYPIAKGQAESQDRVQDRVRKQNGHSFFHLAEIPDRVENSKLL